MATPQVNSQVRRPDPRDTEIQRLRSQIRALGAERDKLTGELQTEIDKLRSDNHKLIAGKPIERVNGKAVEFDKTRTCFVELGRYGDIINILPLARDVFLKTGKKPVIAISKGFDDVVDGVSYADAMPLDLKTVDVLPAIDISKSRFQNVIVSQIFGMGYDPGKKTDAYNMESWRLAGYLDRWADPELKLVFDRRDIKRERNLIERIWPNSEKPVVLLNVSSGHSSPFEGWGEFQKRLLDRWQDQVSFIDVGQLKCERIYDLVGLMELADLLVTIDTATIHLAGATTIPVVALLSYAGGWRMTAPRCRCVASCRSDKWKENWDRINEAIHGVLGRRRRIIHAFESHHTDDSRIPAARKTWESIWERCGWVPSEYSQYVRDAREIGDHRDLPYLKDCLAKALSTATDDDIILFTNDDIILHPDTDAEVRRLMRTNCMISSRRIDVTGFPDLSLPVSRLAEMDTHHFGRDLVAWRASWLRENFSEIPDFILGASEWDLWAAAMARKQCGIDWIMPASPHTCPTCEPAVGHVLHVIHDSQWSKGEKTFPSQIHNRKLFKEWSIRNAPQVYMPWFNEV